MDDFIKRDATLAILGWICPDDRSRQGVESGSEILPGRLLQQPWAISVARFGRRIDGVIAHPRSQRGSGRGARLPQRRCAGRPEPAGKPSRKAKVKPMLRPSRSPRCARLRDRVFASTLTIRPSATKPAITPRSFGSMIEPSGRTTWAAANRTRMSICRSPIHPTSRPFASACRSRKWRPARWCRPGWTTSASSITTARESIQAAAPSPAPARTPNSISRQLRRCQSPSP